MTDLEDIDDTLEAYLKEDEPTSIMSRQLLLEKLTEVALGTVPPPPDTEPACPDAYRKRAAKRHASGVRQKLSFGRYFELDRERRAR